MGVDDMALPRQEVADAQTGPQNEMSTLEEALPAVPAK